MVRDIWSTNNRKVTKFKYGKLEQKKTTATKWSELDYVVTLIALVNFSSKTQNWTFVWELIYTRQAAKNLSIRLHFCQSGCSFFTTESMKTIMLGNIPMKKNRWQSLLPQDGSRELLWSLHACQCVRDRRYRFLIPTCPPSEPDLVYKSTNTGFLSPDQKNLAEISAPSPTHTSTTNPFLLRGFDLRAFLRKLNFFWSQVFRTAKFVLSSRN